MAENGIAKGGNTFTLLATPNANAKKKCHPFSDRPRCGQYTMELGTWGENISFPEFPSGFVQLLTRETAFSFNELFCDTKKERSAYECFQNHTLGKNLF